MKDLMAKIGNLSDEDVARLTIWLFDEEREKTDGDLARAKWKDLGSEEVVMALNSMMEEEGLSGLAKRPQDDLVVRTFRTLLLDYAARAPQTGATVMKDLHMEAGGFELSEILSNLSSSHLIQIIILLSALKPFFRITYTRSSKDLKIEAGFGKGEPVLKALLSRLPIFQPPPAERFDE